MISRREFVLGGLSLAALSAPSLKTWGAADNSEILFGARHDGADKAFSIGVIDLKNKKSLEIPVSFKGHGFAVHPARPERVIVFGHIPSPVSCEIDVATGKMVREFRSAADRHFYGHGSFTPDGKSFLATENDYRGSHGVLVIRDYETGNITGEFPTFGVDPHDMDYCNGGKTLIVANGGLKTRPDYGNGEVAEGPLVSSLAWIDATERKLIRKIELPNHTLSLRHLCRLSNGRYAVIIQDKGFGQADGGLIVLVDSDGKWSLTATEKKMRERMHHHTLSATYLQKDLLAVASPNGNCLSLWKASSGQFVKAIEVPRVSGVMSIHNGKHALVSTNTGSILELDARRLTVRDAGFKWREGFKWGAHLGSTKI